MAQKIRKKPSTSEGEEFRSKEYFESDIERALSLCGDTVATVGSIAAGAVGTVDVEVLGARPDKGQTVQVGVPSGINSGILWQGNVIANDTVRIYLYNRTGSPIVLPEYTYSVRVMP